MNNRSTYSVNCLGNDEEWGALNYISVVSIVWAYLPRAVAHAFEAAMTDVTGKSNLSLSTTRSRRGKEMVQK